MFCSACHTVCVCRHGFVLKGISHIFVVYRQAFALLVLAPFAFFLERKKALPLTYIILCKIFLVSLCGITLSLNLYYVALNYTSATIAVATTTLIPGITYIMAVLMSVGGAILLVGGLYSVLWGKRKEEDVETCGTNEARQNVTKQETGLECITHQ